MLENIERPLEKDRSLREATIWAIQESTSPIIEVNLILKQTVEDSRFPIYISSLRGISPCLGVKQSFNPSR